MRTPKKITFSLTTEFKQQLLNWANQFEEVVWLDSNSYEFSSVEYEAILAVEAFTALKTDYVNAFGKLQEYQQTTKDWIFGYLTYDQKNDVEALSSKNFDGLHFPDLYFFQPKKLFFLKGNSVELHYLKMVDDEMDTDFVTISNFEIVEQPSYKSPIKIHLRIHKDEYFEKLEKMLAHIHRGDIYEANFCQEFYAENTTINPLEIYNKLNAISTPPFATFLKQNDKYLLSASPERYLKKEGQKVISQPIKGTVSRSDKDDQSKIQELLNSEKEQAENLMIVDLVRHDLSRIAKNGSVGVKNLFEIQSFETVHQMVSTVEAEVKEGISAVEILKACFPMGSMTGAPKIAAMRVIDELEDYRRGIYSGAIGYFSPEDDFDFSVVIRTAIIQKEKLFYPVGGAITYDSNPEQEWEETILKAKALTNIVN